MIIESVQFSTNQVWAYNAILKYVVMGNALPNRLQRYEKNRICTSAIRFLFSGRPQTGYCLGCRESGHARQDTVEQGGEELLGELA